MKLHRSKIVASFVRWFWVTLFSLTSAAVVYAQQPQVERWLFIFDLSSQMKKDLPATKTAIHDLLINSVDGQLHEGDSVGIWTYDKELHTGQVPLFNWHPSHASMVASNIFSYLKRQSYRSDSSLQVVQSTLPRVIAGSKRLTVVIFCDGQSQLRGTPYDDGINQSFYDGLTERKKSRQPFVVMLRTQLGKYVNCTVAYPPNTVSFPPFPELPPETNAPAPAKVKVEAPPPAIPPLVIIGTQVGTNLNAKPVITTPKPAISQRTTAPTAPASTSEQTNPIVHPTTSSKANQSADTEKTQSSPPPVQAATNKIVAQATNNISTSTAASAPSSSTNKIPLAATTEPVVTQAIVAATSPALAKPAEPVENQMEAGDSSVIYIWLGVGLLAVAALLVIVSIARSKRRPKGSLISSSMQGDPHRK